MSDRLCEGSPVCLDLPFITLDSFMKHTLSESAEYILITKADHKLLFKKNTTDFHHQRWPTWESAWDIGVSRPLTFGVPRPLTLAETISDRLSFSLSRSDPTEWLDAASEIASKLSLVAGHSNTHSLMDTCTELKFHKVQRPSLKGDMQWFFTKLMKSSL